MSRKYNIINHPYEKEGVKYENPTPSGIPRANIEEYVNEVITLTQFEIASDLGTYVRKIGGEVILSDDVLVDQTESGSILVHSLMDFQIFLSKRTGFLRNRFTIAHELGHLFLHSDFGNRPIKAARHGSSPVEYEANFFAAALLMPETNIRDEYNETSNLSVMASKFLVSPSAMEVRLKTLNLI